MSTQAKASFESSVELVTRDVLREELQHFGRETFQRELTVTSQRILDGLQEQLQKLLGTPVCASNSLSQNALRDAAAMPLASLRNLIAPAGDRAACVAKSNSRESKDDPWSFEIGRASIKQPNRYQLSECDSCSQMSQDMNEYMRDKKSDVSNLGKSGSGESFQTGKGGSCQSFQTGKASMQSGRSRNSTESSVPWNFEIRRKIIKNKCKDEVSDESKEAESLKLGDALQHDPKSENGEALNTQVIRHDPKSENGDALNTQECDDSEGLASLHSCAVRSYSVCSASGFEKPPLHRSSTGSRSLRNGEEAATGVGFEKHAQSWVVKEEMQLMQNHDTALPQFGASGSEKSSISGLVPRCIAASRMRRSIRRFVRSPYLDYGSTVLILLNAVQLGIQTDMAALTLSEDDHVVFQVTDYTFGFCFLVELLLKIYVYRCNFFCKPGCSWNYFDCLVVGIQVVEVIMQFIFYQMDLDGGQDSSGSSSFSVMRVLRVLRLVRVLRMVRIMHLVSELRTIIVAISSSMRSLGWTMLLLLLLVYIIGVYLTQLVTTARRSESCTGRCREELTTYFGSLSRALLVLYQVITGGIDWSEVTEPLMEHISPLLAILFSLYLAFVVFALMNVVTGVFVEAALKSTKHDQDVVLLHHIRHLLKAIDADHSGTISWEEFESQLYSPDMVRLFQTIDLDPEEARDLFRLIDIDGSGEISSDEFINGCLRLRGPAKAIDMAAFMFDYKRSSTALKEHSRLVEDTLAWITQGGLQQLGSSQQGVPQAPATTLRIKMSL